MRRWGPKPARVRSRVFRGLVRLAGVAHPKGGTPADMRLTFWPRRRADLDGGG